MAQASTCSLCSSFQNVDPATLSHLDTFAYAVPPVWDRQRLLKIPLILEDLASRESELMTSTSSGGLCETR